MSCGPLSPATSGTGAGRASSSTWAPVGRWQASGLGGGSDRRMSDEPMPDGPMRDGPNSDGPRHGHSVYEPSEFLGAPAAEVIPESEVSLAQRFLNLRTIGSL